jgi:hypothetical protein
VSLDLDTYGTPVALGVFQVILCVIRRPEGSASDALRGGHGLQVFLGRIGSYRLRLRGGNNGLRGNGSVSVALTVAHDDPATGVSVPQRLGRFTVGWENLGNRTVKLRLGPIAI